MMPNDLASLALRLQCEPQQRIQRRCALFLGHKQSGKSALLSRYLDKEESTTATLGIEYSFFSPSTRQQRKVNCACDMWEIGDSVRFLNLLKFMITKESISCLSVVLVLDLSEPNQLVNNVESLILALRERIKLIKDETSTLDSICHPIYEKESQTLKQGQTRFPVPLLVVGNKYDIFQTFARDQREPICNYLRQLCHQNCAQLVFTSIRSEVLISRFRQLLDQLCLDHFGSTHSDQLDLDKPMLITYSGSLLQGTIDAKDQLQRMRSTLEQAFPTSQQRSLDEEDPAGNDHFKEPKIDLIRSFRLKDLEQIKQKYQLSKQSIARQF